MSSITANNGIFSGLPTQQLIDSIIQQASRPQQLAQRRIQQLQIQQSAVLDINSRVSNLRSVAGAFRISSLFDARTATSSNEDVLTASAATGAQTGSYSFTVDRLVSSQQELSKGFADRDRTGLFAGSWTFESAQARLDRDVALADLNNGQGVERGIINISDGTFSFNVDLSRVGTLGEVVEEINAAADEAGSQTFARVVNGGLELVDPVNGSFTIQSRNGRRTAEDLGLIGAGVADTTNAQGQTVRTGANVWKLGSGTALAAINDGRGLDLPDTGRIDAGEFLGYDLQVQVNGKKYRVDLSEVYSSTGTLLKSAVTTVGEVVTRINEVLDGGTPDPDVSGATLADSGVRASIDASNGRLVLQGLGTEAIVVSENTSQGTTTASDLGLLGSGTGTLNGRRVLAGANSTLVRGLNGGAGLTGSSLVLTTAADDTINVNLSGLTTTREIIDAINTQANGSVIASLNERGNGIELTDTTTGPKTFGASGQAALDLRLGAASNGVITGNSQLAYIGNGTTLASLNSGRGVGSGTLRVTDSTGKAADITIGAEVLTVGQFLREFNQDAIDQGLDVTARINSNGDGIEIVEKDTATLGGVKLKIEDVTGQVAANLNIEGEADEASSANNKLNGTFERTVEFDDADTLDDLVTKINDAGVGVAASIINDGSGLTPFRLSLTSTEAGAAGRVIVDSGAFELGLRTIDRGQNARVFFGSRDPASALLLESSTNTVDGVVRGVSIDLKGTSDGPVSLSVTNDLSRVEEQVGEFVDAFNETISRINQQTRYVQETDQRGPLLGDGTTLSLRSELFNLVNGRNLNFSTGYDTLASVGIRVGTDAQLEFDAERFRAAYLDDPQAVEALFTRRDVDTTTTRAVDGLNGVTVTDATARPRVTAAGVIVRLEELANSYITSDNGVLTRKTSTIGDQIEQQQARIDSIQVSLDRRRAILERQYLAAEQVIAQLQSQGASLAQLG